MHIAQLFLACIKHVLLNYYSCKNKDTLHKYSRWALDRDETKGVTVFIEEPEQRVLSPSAVLELLIPYNTATLMYLEYLINVKNSEVQFAP